MLSKNWAPALRGNVQTPDRLDRLSKAETGGGAQSPNERPFGCSAAPNERIAPLGLSRTLYGPV